MKIAETLTLIATNQLHIMRHLGIEPATKAEPLAIPDKSKKEVYESIIENLYAQDDTQFRTTAQIRIDIGKHLGFSVPQKDSYHLGRILSQSFPVGTKMIKGKVQRGYAIKVRE